MLLLLYGTMLIAMVRASTDNRVFLDCVMLLCGYTKIRQQRLDAQTPGVY